MKKDVMSVEYTELDYGQAAIVFCSDITVAITNKTMVKSFCNYVENDMEFKINNLKINPSLALTTIGEHTIRVDAKVNGKFVMMGYVYIEDMLKVLEKVLESLEDKNEKNS